MSTQIRVRLPPDLSPALAATQRAGQDGANPDGGKDEEKDDNNRHRKRKRKEYRHTSNNDSAAPNPSDTAGGDSSSSSSSSSSNGHHPHRQHDRHRRSGGGGGGLEAFRRDMLRAALGAGLAEALALGPKRGAPAAAARVAGTDENNALRVATLAASEAARGLGVIFEDAGAAEEVGGRGRRKSRGGGRRSVNSEGRAGEAREGARGRSGGGGRDGGT